MTLRSGTAARSIAQAEVPDENLQYYRLGPDLVNFGLLPPPADRLPEHFGQLEKFLMILTVLELQILLKARGLTASGDKHALCSRLVRQLTPQTTQEAFLRFLTVHELKVLLKSRGLFVGGMKTDLITRLVEHSRRQDT